MKVIEKYLLVDSVGNARILARRPPRMSYNEVMYLLRIRVPESWGSLAGTISIDLPQPLIVEGSSVLLPPITEEHDGR